MKTPEPPTPLDPIEVGAAQTSTNIGTALAQAGLNQINQVTPDGTLTYEQTGTWDWTDPVSGEVYTLPKTTVTQSLSDKGQQLHDVGMDSKIGLANFANEQIGRMNGLLSEPVDLSNDAVEARLWELARKRLDPKFAEARDRLDTTLANQGIRRGSAAYDRAVRNFSQNENDAYNSLLLQGRGQAVQEALTQRNQPINELTALMSGSQVSYPTFQGVQGPSIPTTDYAGLFNAQYNQQYDQYQDAVNQQNQIMGGLFGLAGNAIGIMPFM